MPSTNHFKFGASELLSATRGGFAVGVKSGTDYGPTSLTGFWNGITPPVGGYTIYVDKASQGPSIHVAYDNTECIKMLLHMGATGSTIENVLAWANGQSNMAVLSDELTVGDLPGGSTPTPTPQPTSTPTPTPTSGASYYTYSWDIDTLYGGSDCSLYPNNPTTYYSSDASITLNSTIMYSDSALTTPIIGSYNDGVNVYYCWNRPPMGGAPSGTVTQITSC